MSKFTQWVSKFKEENNKAPLTESIISEFTEEMWDNFSCKTASMYSSLPKKSIKTSGKCTAYSQVDKFKYEEEGWDTYLSLKDFHEGQGSKEQSSIKEEDDENDSMIQWLDNEDEVDWWANIFDNTEKRLDTKFEFFWECSSHAKGDIKKDDDENDSLLQWLDDEEEVDRW